MSHRLENKIAVITGATNGMGRAAARLFVREGAHVYITGRGQPALDKMKAELGDDVTIVRADSSIPADLDRLYDTIKQKHGRLDIVYANAGHGEFASIAEVTSEHIANILSVNVVGTILTVNKALSLLGITTQ